MRKRETCWRHAERIDGLFHACCWIEAQAGGAPGSMQSGREGLLHACMLEVCVSVSVCVCVYCDIQKRTSLKSLPVLRYSVRMTILRTHTHTYIHTMSTAHRRCLRTHTHKRAAKHVNSIQCVCVSVCVCLWCLCVCVCVCV